jgi:plasmid stabilization system protein ParE
MIDIIIQPDAVNDILEAAKWYDNNLKGLGESFLGSVDSAIYSVQQNPEAYPKVYKELRRILLKKFPFGIFYLIEENNIVIVAVFHASRNPKQWKGRTK